MRIAVIGAGAIGGTMAALLDRAGHQVTVVARGANLAAIAGGGIRFSGAWGEHLAMVRAVDSLDAVPELAIVATKAQDAEAAVSAQARFLAGIPVVVVQNGLEAVESARRAAPRSDLVGALALYAASYLSPGEVTVTAAAATYLGGPVPATLFASKVIGAVMPVELTDNFEGAQWTKLVVNHLNALPAITGLSVQQVVADPRLRLILTRSMREAVRVAKKRGIVFEPLSGLTDRILSLLLSLPVGLGQFLPRMMVRRMGSTPNPGSTLQSIRRGQPTEIDYLNGAVVRLGAQSAVPTPVSAMLVELVHEVERGSGFFSVDAVVARIG
ncbi:2-dehydropantoate 2-reductase [soil metagenome]